MSEVEEALRRFYDAELPERAGRPLGDARERQVREFARWCAAEGRAKGWAKGRAKGRVRVLEVGCGAGRDGRLIAAAGAAYVGLDLSPVGARVCREAGLLACAGSALALPFGDGAFDAAWTMSTLMHLPGDGMVRALAELRRVLAPGGLLEVGVWGRETDGDRLDEHGRYFRHRTDEEVRRLLGTVGEVVGFATWDHLDDVGAHYQWARVRAG